MSETRRSSLMGAEAMNKGRTDKNKTKDMGNIMDLMKKID
jgi:hypothetical protein